MRSPGADALEVASPRALVHASRSAVRDVETWDRLIRSCPSDEWELGRQRTKTVRPLFGSPEAALREYVEHVEEGYHQGSTGESFARLARMGTAVQTSGRPESGATREAERVAEIRRSLSHALSASTCAPLPVATALECLLLMRVGRAEIVKGKTRSTRKREPMSAEAIAELAGLDVTDVRRVCRLGMRRFRVELAARGLVPMVGRSSRLYADIARRREELGE